MASLRKLWNEYWFRPAPLVNLAICRILIVGYQLYLVANDYGYYLDAVTVPGFLYDPLPVLELFIWPLGSAYRPGYETLVAVYWATFGAGVAGVIGLFNRISLWIFALGSIFLQAYVYSFGEVHHSQGIMMIALLVLAISPSGRVLSVDDLWGRLRSSAAGVKDYFSSILAKKSEHARWPLRLLAVMMGLIYLDAALSKILESGLDWTNGYTLQYYLAQDGLRWNRALGLWLSQHHTLAKLMSWGATIFELTFFLVIFFPTLALLYVPTGIVFHTGIYVAMYAPFFTYLTVYSVFVPWNVVLEYIHDGLRTFMNAPPMRSSEVT